MDCEEVFGQLLRYFSESDDKRMCANIRSFALACLAAGEFEAAEKYADILLAQDSGGAAQQIIAYRIKLFCRLKCKNDDDFLHCPAFNKDMEEYQNLIVVCADDARSLKMYMQMANANAETVAQDEARRLEQEALARQRRAEEEKQRQLQLLQERTLRREKCSELVKISLGVIFFNILPLCLIITGFVLWGASDIDKYTKPVLIMVSLIVAVIIAACGIKVKRPVINVIAIVLLVFSLIVLFIAGIIFNIDS